MKSRQKEETFTWNLHEVVEKFIPEKNKATVQKKTLGRQPNQNLSSQK